MKNGFLPEQNVVVPISQNAEAFAPEDRIPRFIPVGIRVLASIDFHDNSLLERSEVQNEISKGYLTAKFG